MVNVPEDPFVEFLKMAKLKMYWGVIRKKEYRDFDTFMEETDAQNMAEVIGLEKMQGHSQRLISRWRVMKHKSMCPTVSWPPVAAGPLEEVRQKIKLVPAPKSSKH